MRKRSAPAAPDGEIPRASRIPRPNANRNATHTPAENEPQHHTGNHYRIKQLTQTPLPARRGKKPNREHRASHRNLLPESATGIQPRSPLPESAAGACHWNLLLESATGACYKNLAPKPATRICCQSLPVQSATEACEWNLLPEPVTGIGDRNLLPELAAGA